jgi:hypothetical protein
MLWRGEKWRAFLILMPKINAFSMIVYSLSSTKELQENIGKIIYFSESDSPLYNGVLDEDAEASLKAEDIKDTVLFFKIRQRPFCWWTFSKKNDCFLA